LKVAEYFPAYPKTIENLATQFVLRVTAAADGSFVISLLSFVPLHPTDPREQHVWHGLLQQLCNFSLRTRFAGRDNGDFGFEDSETVPASHYGSSRKRCDATFTRALQSATADQFQPCLFSPLERIWDGADRRRNPLPAVGAAKCPLLRAEPSCDGSWVESDAGADAKRGNTSSLGVFENRDSRYCQDCCEVICRQSVANSFDLIGQC
jgi:hypothetical protein